MSQFQKGLVAAQYNDATVLHVWECHYTTGGGAYNGKETVTWAATGYGFYCGEDTTNKILYIARESGEVPEVDDVILGSTSSETRTVTALSATSPPDYDNPSTGIVAADTFLVEATGETYVVSTTINDDNFELTAPYQGTENLLADYAVVRDYSPYFSAPLPGVGDIDAVTVAKSGINVLDKILKFLGFNEQTWTSAGAALNINWKLGNKGKWTLTESATVTFNPAPWGPAILWIRITQAAGGYTVTWPSSVEWQGDTGPDIANMNDGEVGLVQLYYDGTYYYGSFWLNYIA